MRCSGLRLDADPVAMSRFHRIGKGLFQRTERGEQAGQSDGLRSGDDGKGLEWRNWFTVVYRFSENEVKMVLGEKVLKDMKSVLDDIDIASEENKQLLEQLRGLSCLCLFMINSCVRRIGIS